MWCALRRPRVFQARWAPGVSGEIGHISLADEAERLLVAPATANSLGKFARGIADDALSTLYLATRAPVLVAPAMNVRPGPARQPIPRSVSPPRRPSARTTAKRPRSGIVPAFVIARRPAPWRARIVPPTRSHTIRGRSSPNSAGG